MSIDPEALRRRLEEVWTELGRQADADGNEVTRACALTLIAVVDEDDQADAASETLAELMREYPSRDIVLRLTPGAVNLLEADVDARCWMPSGGRRQICSEQIVIRCSDETLGEVAGVIDPLLVPDLPVVLWCPSERARSLPAFQAVAEPADRIFVDSFGSPQPADALGKLRLLAEKHPQISDLSWTRLTRWRALLAQVFQNELYRLQIPKFDELAVRYESREPGRIPPTALLLAGWIVSRLNWAGQRIIKPEGTQRNYASSTLAVLLACSSSGSRQTCSPGVCNRSPSLPTVKAAPESPLRAQSPVAARCGSRLRAWSR